MPDYNKIAANALALIAKNGKEYDIRRPRRIFNDTSGTATNIPSTAGKLTAVVLPRYKGMVFDSLDDGLKEAAVRGSARTVLAAAQGAAFSPDALDEITINGSVWLVIGCTPLSPAGIDIIYTIGVVLK